MAVIFYFVFGGVKKSDFFVEAVKRAESSSEIQAAIGIPIDTGWIIQGSLNYVNGSGSANFNIPLKGPLGEAALLAVGEKAVGGPWNYSQLEAVLPNGSRIILLHETASQRSTESEVESRQNK